MVEIPANPLLGEKEYQELKAALDATRWATGEIAKAEKAGINMDANKLANQENKTRIEGLMRVYFPNRPM